VNNLQKLKLQQDEKIRKNPHLAANLALGGERSIQQSIQDKNSTSTLPSLKEIKINPQIILDMVEKYKLPVPPQEA
jgi:hypothetical protein